MPWYVGLLMDIYWPTYRSLFSIGSSISMKKQREECCCRWTMSLSQENKGKCWGSWLQERGKREIHETRSLPTHTARQVNDIESRIMNQTNDSMSTTLGHKNTQRPSDYEDELCPIHISFILWARAQLSHRNGHGHRIKTWCGRDTIVIMMRADVYYLMARGLLTGRRPFLYESFRGTSADLL